MKIMRTIAFNSGDDDSKRNNPICLGLEFPTRMVWPLYLYNVKQVGLLDGVILGCLRGRL